MPQMVEEVMPWSPEKKFPQKMLLALAASRIIGPTEKVQPRSIGVFRAIEPGFNRCRTLIQAAVSKHGPPLPPDMINGLCANLHREATGAMPGHAPGEEAAHAAKKAAKGAAKRGH